MIKIISKHKIVFPILVLLYLNFYFLSPFIHEHPVEIEGQVETENTLHSHLTSNNPNFNNSNIEGYVNNVVTSHTHNYSFSKPIIIQHSQKFNNVFTYSISSKNDESYKELESKFDIVSKTRSQDKVLWERYVQFASNSSPPVVDRIAKS